MYMKKKLLSIFLTPLFITPIILSSCSSNDMSMQKVFTYKSEDYQLEIHPYAYYDYDSKSNVYCNSCNVSVIFNHPDTATKNQQIYIDSLTINDSYTNPDNGIKYKTCIVTFANDKNKVLTKDGSDANVEYVIGNFSVSASVFAPGLNLNSADEIDSTKCIMRGDGGYDVDSYKYGPYDSSWSGYEEKYLPNFSLRYPKFDVQVLSEITRNKYVDGDYAEQYAITPNNPYEIDGTPTFSDKLVAIDGFNFTLTSGTTITLPTSLKIITYNAFQYQNLYQDNFVIPQSVEKIGENAFEYFDLKGANDDSSSTANKVIKVPSKFKNDEEKIFGETRSDIQYY